MFKTMKTIAIAFLALVTINAFASPSLNADESSGVVQNQVYLVGSKKSDQYVVRFDFHRAYVAHGKASEQMLKRNAWGLNAQFQSQSYMRQLAFESAHNPSISVLNQLKSIGLWQGDQIISSGDIPTQADFAFCGYLSIDDYPMMTTDGSIAEMCIGELAGKEANTWFISSDGFVPSQDHNAHYFRTMDGSCYQLSRVKGLDSYFALRLQDESHCGS